jgi:glycosyltransferase involved in cell wall biosynthesis
MRDVLLVSYYFPPSGGPGVQRALKFARYLPEYGYRPLVLTVPEDAEFPARDPSLIAECPPSGQIIRSSILEFYNLYRRLAGGGSRVPLDIQSTSAGTVPWRRRVLRRLRGAFFIPDGRMGWLLPGTRAGIRACRQRPVSAIWATGPPFTAHWIAARISAGTGLPLVLDFRDPWTRAPFYPPRPGWARRLDERLEHRCLRRASRVVTAFPSIGDDFLTRYPDLDPGKFSIITNGFDPSDFADLSPEPFPEWTLAHTGSIFASRIPHTLFDVLPGWLAQDPDRARRVRIRLAGRVDPALEPLLARPPLDAVVQYQGYLSHRDSVKLLVDSHLLLLLVVEDPQAGRFIPGKLFEYIGSGTPILALAPEGEAADLIRRTKAGRVVTPGDGEAIRRALDEAYRAYREGTRPFGSPDPDAVAALTRKALTARLAGLLDGITG